MIRKQSERTNNKVFCGLSLLPVAMITLCLATALLITHLSGLLQNHLGSPQKQPLPSSQDSSGQVSSLTNATVESETKWTHMGADTDVYQRINHFRNTALTMTTVTDKVGLSSQHTYHNMYGMFLLPYAANKPNMKMLEIGLGCNMNYGPGASVALWKKLFPQAELWLAEYNAPCVQKAKERNMLDGIHVVTGDQSDPATLQRWVKESNGGNFDIIIDDGGHKNCQISTSFDYLWPALLPGGYYFIEDLQVGRWKGWQCGGMIMSDRITEWIDRLLYKYTDAKTKSYKYTMPEDVLFVFCQAEACVIGKRQGPVNDAATDADKGMAKTST